MEKSEEKHNGKTIGVYGSRETSTQPNRKTPWFTEKEEIGMYEVKVWGHNRIRQYTYNLLRQQ